MDPSLKVGGPATAGLIDLSNFTDAADAAGIPYDFVSSHKVFAVFRFGFVWFQSDSNKKSLCNLLKTKRVMCAASTLPTATARAALQAGQSG